MIVLIRVEKYFSAGKRKEINIFQFTMTIILFSHHSNLEKMICKLSQWIMGIILDLLELYLGRQQSQTLNIGEIKFFWEMLGKISTQVKDFSKSGKELLPDISFLLKEFKKQNKKENVKANALENSVDKLRKSGSPYRKLTEGVPQERFNLKQLAQFFIQKPFVIHIFESLGSSRDKLANRTTIEKNEDLMSEHALMMSIRKNKNSTPTPQQEKEKKRSNTTVSVLSKNAAKKSQIGERLIHEGNLFLSDRNLISDRIRKLSTVPAVDAISEQEIKAFYEMKETRSEKIEVQVLSKKLYLAYYISSVTDTIFASTNIGNELCSLHMEDVLKNEKRGTQLLKENTDKRYGAIHSYEKAKVSVYKLERKKNLENMMYLAENKLKKFYFVKEKVIVQGRFQILRDLKFNVHMDMSKRFRDIGMEISKLLHFKSVENYFEERRRIEKYKWYLYFLKGVNYQLQGYLNSKLFLDIVKPEDVQYFNQQMDSINLELKKSDIRKKKNDLFTLLNLIGQLIQCSQTPKENVRITDIDIEIKELLKFETLIDLKIFHCKESAIFYKKNCISYFNLEGKIAAISFLSNAMDIRAVTGKMIFVRYKVELFLQCIGYYYQIRNKSIRSKTSKFECARLSTQSPAKQNILFRSMHEKGEKRGDSWNYVDILKNIHLIKFEIIFSNLYEKYQKRQMTFQKIQPIIHGLWKQKENQLIKHTSIIEEEIAAFSKIMGDQYHEAELFWHKKVEIHLADKVEEFSVPEYETIYLEMAELDYFVGEKSFDIYGTTLQGKFSNHLKEYLEEINKGWQINSLPLYAYIAAPIHTIKQRNRINELCVFQRALDEYKLKSFDNMINPSFRLYSIIKPFALDSASKFLNKSVGEIRNYIQGKCDTEEAKYNACNSLDQTFEEIDSVTGEALAQQFLTVSNIEIPQAYQKIEEIKDDLLKAKLYNLRLDSFDGMINLLEKLSFIIDSTMYIYLKDDIEKTRKLYESQLLQINSLAEDIYLKEHQKLLDSVVKFSIVSKIIGMTKKQKKGPGLESLNIILNAAMSAVSKQIPFYKNIISTLDSILVKPHKYIEEKSAWTGAKLIFKFFKSYYSQAFETQVQEIKRYYQVRSSFLSTITTNSGKLVKKPKEIFSDGCEFVLWRNLILDMNMKLSQNYLLYYFPTITLALFVERRSTIKFINAKRKLLSFQQLEKFKLKSFHAFTIEKILKKMGSYSASLKSGMLLPLLIIEDNLMKYQYLKNLANNIKIVDSFAEVLKEVFWGSFKKDIKNFEEIIVTLKNIQLFYLMSFKRILSKNDIDMLHKYYSKLIVLHVDEICRGFGTLQNLTFILYTKMDVKLISY